jgi:hypothetical protein
MIRIGTLGAGSLVAGLLASELRCIEAMFTDDQARTMAQLGSPDEAAAKAAADKLDWMRLGMQSRMCAIRGKWNDAEYGNAVGYMMAWPTARGLRLAGEAQGYAALDRAYAARAADFAAAKRLQEDQVSAIIAAAAGNGLQLAEGEAAAKEARRYVDALQQLDAMRADFAAGRKPRQIAD